MKASNVDGSASQRAALELRYGQDAMPAAGPWNEAIGLMLDHRSVRGFKPDPLPAGTLETMMAAAQSAATSSNLQTWSVVAVSNPATRAEFAKIANNQKHIEQCPLFLTFLADLSRLERLGQQEKVDLETLPYLETFLVAAIDAALAAQNAVLAAESLGLSTVYIGAMRNNPVRVAELLKLPKQVMCVFGLCVGYAADGVTNAVKPRLPQSAIVHQEHYSGANDREIRKDYDDVLGRYSREQEMNQYSWTERVLSRTQPLKAMSGRHALREALAALGIPAR
jgi:nitroreductase